MYFLVYNNEVKMTCYSQEGDRERMGRLLCVCVFVCEKKQKKNSHKKRRRGKQERIDNTTQVVTKNVGVKHVREKKV